MSKKSLPHYLQVFEKRVLVQKEKIKAELAKGKHNRDKHLVKRLLNDIKIIRKALKEAKEEHANRCPKCGHRL